MIDLACTRARAALDARASGLSSADALRLEEHLSGCQACSSHAQLLAGLRGLVTSDMTEQPTQLTAAQREQVFATAFVLAARVQPRAAGRSRRPVVLAAALAAALVLALLARTLVHEPAPQLASVVDGAELHPRESEIVALAHAKVELRAHSHAHWSAGPHDLALSEGSVWVEVDPGPKQPFSVTTPRFSVHVLGTRFSVTTDAVSVVKGRVRVQATDGRVLRVLSAGERFAWSEASEAKSIASIAQTPASPQPSAAVLNVAAHDEHPRSGAVLVDEARAQLAAGHVARARQVLGSALASTLSPPDRAEALTLRAECALVDGDKARASRDYLQVAHAYPNGPAGENALFAAARIESERTGKADRGALIERYLARYPDGRFVKEAQARLRQLHAVSDHAR